MWLAGLDAHPSQLGSRVFNSSARGCLLPRSFLHLSQPSSDPRKIGIHIKPPKVDLNEQGELGQVLPRATPFVAYSGVPTPFLASASKLHTILEWHVAATNPCSELARSGWGSPAPLLHPASEFLPNLSFCPWLGAVPNSGGRLLASSCRRSSGFADGMGWQVSTRCKTCALNLA